MTDRTNLTWPGPQEILSQPGALKGQDRNPCPLKLTTAPFVLSRPSFYHRPAGWNVGAPVPEGPGQAGGREAQVVLRGDPWAPESSSPTGATKLGLVVGQGAFACLGCSPDGEAAGAGQGTQSRGGGGGQRPALLAPASSFPGFLTLFSTATQRRLGRALFTTQQMKPPGKGKRMKGLGVLNFGFGVFSWFEKIIKGSCFCHPINLKPTTQSITCQQ